MRNDPKAEESLGYFNLARGVGMILIVAGHSANVFLPVSERVSSWGKAGSVLGGGLMAMFFMISGFGFYKRSPRKCFSIQKKMLLKPYFFVASAVLGTRLFLAIVKQRSFWTHGGELVLTYVLGLNAEGGGKLFTIPVESISILWFLLALFIGWNLYNAIVQLSSGSMQKVLVMGCVILSYLLTQISKVWFYCLPMGLLAVGYLAAGDYIHKKGLLSKEISIWCRGLLMVFSILQMMFGNINIVACVWKLGLLDVAGTFCIGFLIMRLYAEVMRWKLKGRVVGFLEEIGLKSIWIVCLHAYEKIIFPWYRIRAVFTDHVLLGICLCFLARCAIMYVFYRIILVIRRKWRKQRKTKILIQS